ncbi:hypothetical protein HPB50_013927 [Hyalomma asiaticum]|uniref:Uncharacterized protein n=1 Tax=Hyalomma asiaticum TaxID=266040 RepID=A0ACB7SHR1_HYAAI|nr:hypothetical protein HPB50_013927 [Hyalomma asiaticum]
MQANQELTSERLVIFSPDVETGTLGAPYTAYLCGRVVDQGHVTCRAEAENILRSVDAYSICKGALPTSSMSRVDLSKDLELQVTIREGMYVSKRCSGKQPVRRASMHLLSVPEKGPSYTTVKAEATA